MKLRPGRLIFALLLPFAAACSLFVSLGDLQGPDGGTTPSSDGGSLDAPAEVGADASSDAGGSPDAGLDSSLFADDFNRPNGDDIGNGWIEKNPAAFGIAGNRAMRTSDRSVDYVDNLVYRPASENVADTEVSVELTFVDDAGGYPQVHARAQSDSVATSGTLDSYLLYAQTSTTGFLSRVRGKNNLNDLQPIDISPPLDIGPTYRFRLKVSGAHPVHVTGYIEIQAGSTWNVIGFAN
ncbi:MAG: hypothetical protein ABI551_25630, partial [Polyangiaceae bacterium]